MTYVLVDDILSKNVTFIAFKTKIYIYQSINFTTFTFMNIPTNALYYKIKFLEFKHYIFHLFRPFSVGYYTDCT